MRRGRAKVCRCRVIEVDGLQVTIRTANGKDPTPADIDAIREVVRCLKAMKEGDRHASAATQP